MNSIALRNLAEEISVAEEHLRSRQRMARRNLRDESNPLELPQSLFQKYYRINKPAFRYLLEIFFGVPPIVKLSKLALAFSLKVDIRQVLAKIVTCH